MRGGKYIKCYDVHAAHYNCGVQADVLAAESARRDASKLSASSALMTSLRLRREIERVFEQRSLADTGAACDIHTFFPYCTTGSFLTARLQITGGRKYCHALQGC